MARRAQEKTQRLFLDKTDAERHKQSALGTDKRSLSTRAALPNTSPAHTHTPTPEATTSQRDKQTSSRLAISSSEQKRSDIQHLDPHPAQLRSSEAIYTQTLSAKSAVDRLDGRGEYTTSPEAGRVSPSAAQHIVVRIPQIHGTSTKTQAHTSTTSATPPSNDFYANVNGNHSARQLQELHGVSSLEGQSHEESSMPVGSQSKITAGVSPLRSSTSRKGHGHVRSSSESRVPHRASFQDLLATSFSTQPAHHSPPQEAAVPVVSKPVSHERSNIDLRRSKGVRLGACPFETTLAQATRRIPYGMADKPLILSDKLAMSYTLTADEDARLSQELIALYETLLPSDEGIRSKQAFIHKLERLLKSEWPGKDFTVHAFGSTENLLGTDTSDLDVCIVTSWKGFATQTCHLSSFMHRSGMQSVVCRAGAKVPVVAIYDPELKVACDMNINNKLALRNSKLVRTYMEIDVRARQLAYFVKHWAKCRALNDAVCNTLTSYSWALLVINFLQVRQPPVLPCLHSWPHDTIPPLQGIDVSFADDVQKFGLSGFGRHNHESIGALVFGFFHYYTYLFNYPVAVASVRSGGVVERASKGFAPDQLFGIEEPFTTSRNLGNTADMDSHRGIHLELARIHEFLANGRTFEDACEPYVFRGPKSKRYQIHPQAKSGNRRQAHMLQQPRSHGHIGRSGFYQPGAGQVNYQTADPMTDFGSFRHHNPEYHAGNGVPIEHLQFLQSAFPLSVQYYQQFAHLLNSMPQEEHRSYSERRRSQEVWRRRQPLQNLSERQHQRQSNQQRQSFHQSAYQRQDLSAQGLQNHSGALPHPPQPLLYSLDSGNSQRTPNPAQSLNGYLDHVTQFQRTVSLAYCDALVQNLEPALAPHQAAGHVSARHGSECSDTTTASMTRATSSRSSPSSSGQHSPTISASMPYMDTAQSGERLHMSSFEMPVSLHDVQGLRSASLATSSSFDYASAVQHKNTTTPPKRRSSHPQIAALTPASFHSFSSKPSYARVASKPSSPDAQERTTPLVNSVRATVQ
ncbi:hypothetical protein BCR37DRAFT_379310 [Protomyces lactucae-debilis]|uniref:polynucleotide adenylyltransferase n=1 Tax=Protomyces lactucae-debilis TaxID=2754530 RepID=A0A1Y2FJ40_PROLT|nr:uncharacterized protein BCR37DRAFT_379310 [Protomyces lactucae-debilis]ORY83276.1 hypothetical protein BCR37DRAFT_379310 [Protomyces lactucae-debilis]